MIMMTMMMVLAILDKGSLCEKNDIRFYEERKKFYFRKMVFVLLLLMATVQVCDDDVLVMIFVLIFINDNLLNADADAENNADNG